MPIEEKIYELRQKIYEKLLPMIDYDYVLWDLPYHKNIGDILIWQGELDFLKLTGKKCLDFSSHLTCTYPFLDEKVVILLHGGGNFGDIYSESQEFRRKIIMRYPKNKIIILPQTVFYNDAIKLKNDGELFSLHPNLTICVRDNESYCLVKKNFQNNIILLPDMAFCINTLSEFSNNTIKTGRKLLLYRIDDEAVDIDLFSWDGFEISDWPTFQKNNILLYILKGLIKLCNITDLKIFKIILNSFSYRILRNNLFKLGVDFLMKYDEIYTTRLHVLILSILLQKEHIVIIDNNYGKCRSFYLKWLSDLKSIDLY